MAYINGKEILFSANLTTLPIVVDSRLSTTSENPVQNKVVTAALSELEERVYDIVENGSTSGGGSLEQVQSDWEQTDTTKVDYIKNKPDFNALDSKYTELNNKVNQLSSGGLTRHIVDSLPDTSDGDVNAIYMVLNSNNTEGNIYDEYMLTNNDWELIGSTAVDLTNYATKEYVDNKSTALIQLITWEADD